RDVTPDGEARVAKIASLVVKVGALLVILFLPTQFALDLQLLGGVWILQTLPAVVFALFFPWPKASALFAGWLVGFGSGTWMAIADGVKPLHTVAGIAAYTGLWALALNVGTVLIVSAILHALSAKEKSNELASSV